MKPLTILPSNVDAYWLSLARAVSCFSNDPYTKVGCVIVGSDGEMISAGFNYLPDGFDIRWMTREEKNAQATHAEDHALSVARESTVQGVAYLWPVEPCFGCAKKLSNAGVSSVVAPIDQYSAVFSKWRDNLLESRQHFESKNIRLRYFDSKRANEAMIGTEDEKIQASLATLRCLWQR
jgi:deoxycytidylate deaminase